MDGQYIRYIKSEIILIIHGQKYFHYSVIAYLRGPPGLEGRIP